MPEYHIPYGEDEVIVFDESPTHKEIDILWINAQGQVDIKLVALWESSTFFSANGEDCFQPGDYFQQNIIADPTGNGLGPLLLDFIATNKENLGFAIVNFYSTRLTGDATGVSIYAKKMWDNMVQQDRAIYHEALERYQLQWRD